MKFSAFASFGALQFKANEPIERALYEALIKSLGSGKGLNVEPGGFTDCFAFMAAKLIGMASRKLERGADQIFARKVYDLLSAHEHEHKIVPSPDATIPQRKKHLLATKLAREGSKPSSLVEQLHTLLGDEFVGVHIVEPNEREIWPDECGGQPMILAPPTMDRKIAQSLVPISVGLGNPHTLPYAAIDPVPANGEALFNVGDVLIIEPEIMGRCERVTVAAIGTTTIDGTSYNTITMTPMQAHEPLCTIASLSYPLWMSTQREIVVIVKPSVIASSAKLKQLNNLLDQVVTGVSTWCVVQESEFNSGQAEAFMTDNATYGMLDANPLTAVQANLVY